MTISVVAQGNKVESSAASTISKICASALTAGSVLVVYICGWDSVSSSTDAVVTGVADGTHTYKKAVGASRVPTNTQERAEIWYAENVTSSTPTVVVTYAGTNNYRCLLLEEVKGLATSYCLDVTSSNSNVAVTTHTSGSATTTINNEFIAGCGLFYADDTPQPGTGYTFLYKTAYFSAEYKIVSATGSMSATATTDSNDDSVYVMATFADTSISPPGASAVQINVGDTWKSIDAVGDMKINIGDTWKDVSAVQVNIGDVWKTVYP